MLALLGLNSSSTSDKENNIPFDGILFWNTQFIYLIMWSPQRARPAVDVRLPTCTLS